MEDTVGPDVEKATSSASRRPIAGHFAKARRRSDTFLGEDDPDHPSWVQTARHRVHKVMKSVITDIVLGTVVIIDVWMTALGTDYRAAKDPEPAWLTNAGYVCLSVYVLELGCHVFVRRLYVFRDPWIMLDLMFVIAGFGEILLSVAGITMDSLGILRILRIARMARLVKVFRKFTWLKELRKLLQMASSCVKTLFWSFLFCFVVMTTFAMIAVEFLGPLVTDLADRGLLNECGDSCVRAMESVTFANLYLFKTIIAGDGWGALAWPMMEAYPSTSVIFIGSHLVIVFGVLNMIVAVVVDTAAEQRLRDVKSLAEELEAETESDLKFLEKIFREMDEDGSNDVDLGELLKGAEALPDFSERLRVMDIDSNDLEQLFHMLDADGGGSIDLDEFRQALSRWMLNDSKTAARFAKYSMDSMNKQLEQLSEQFGMLISRVDGVAGESKANVVPQEGKGLEGAIVAEAPLLAQPQSPSSALSPRSLKQQIVSTTTTTTTSEITTVRKQASLELELEVSNASSSAQLGLESLLSKLQMLADDVRAAEQQLDQASADSTNELLAKAMTNIREQLEKKSLLLSAHQRQDDTASNKWLVAQSRPGLQEGADEEHPSHQRPHGRVQNHAELDELSVRV